MRGLDAGPRPARRTEPGFALAAAVFALLILSALAAGAFYAAFEEVRIGRNGRAAESAFEAAEAGLSRAEADGPPEGWGAIPVGDSSLFVGTLPAGTGRFSGAFFRLNGQLFLIRSTGADAAGEGQRTVAALARLDTAGVARTGSLDGASMSDSSGAPAAVLRPPMSARLIPERSWSELY